MSDSTASSARSVPALECGALGPKLDVGAPLTSGTVDHSRRWVAVTWTEGKTHTAWMRTVPR